MLACSEEEHPIGRRQPAEGAFPSLHSGLDRSVVGRRLVLLPPLWQAICAARRSCGLQGPGPLAWAATGSGSCQRAARHSLQQILPSDLLSASAAKPFARCLSSSGLSRPATFASVHHALAPASPPSSVALELPALEQEVMAALLVDRAQASPAAVVSICLR